MLNAFSEIVHQPRDHCVNKNECDRHADEPAPHFGPVASERLFAHGLFRDERQVGRTNLDDFIGLEPEKGLQLPPNEDEEHQKGQEKAQGDVGAGLAEE